MNKPIPTKAITIRPRDKAFMNNSNRKLVRMRNRIRVNIKKGR